MHTALTIMLSLAVGAAEPPVDRAANAAAAVGADVVVVGGTLSRRGHELAAETEVLDTETLSWSRAADIPTPRAFPAAVALHGRVMVIGGLREATPYSADVETYHVADDRWSRQPDMPTARNRMGACAIGGRVYVAGGMGLVDGRADGTLSVLERWDPTTATWERLADMARGRHGHGVVAYEGEVWVIGGYTDDGMTDSVEVYDPQSDAWRDGPALPEPRGFPNVAVVAGRIVVTNSRSDAALTSVIYEDGAWRPGPPVPDDRHRCGVAVVGDRMYLISGDSGRAAHVTPHTIWLDVDSETWRSIDE